MSTDADLLRCYVQKHDERAFTALVARHLDLVYAAALRRTAGQTHLAEEISQKVFADLARKAARLQCHPALIGWLHRSTRYAAIDVVRTESRRHQLNEALTVMPDPVLTSDSSLDWEQLRPVLDAAMDQLKERDRELMLLRFFKGFTYAEAGARLRLSEDAARRRIERALDKLRVNLGRRGITSTTAALGLLLANQPMVAAPMGLSAAVTAISVAATPANAAASLTTFLFMNKITLSAITAALAAGLTVLTWTSVAQGVSAEELTALRTENARLTSATVPGAPGAALAKVADEYAVQAAAIAKAMEGRQAKSSQTQAVSAVSPQVTARGHRDHGTSTAGDAAKTFAWASDIADPAALAKLLYFDAEARELAEVALAAMPESIRAKYRTPEEFYGLLIAVACVEAPPPGADLMAAMMVEVELSPGRVAMRRRGTSVNYHEYQLTSSGWKYVLPAAGVQGMLGLLNNRTFAKLSGQ